MGENTEALTKFVKRIRINLIESQNHDPMNYDFVNCYFLVSDNVLSIKRENDKYTYNFPLSNIELFFYED